MSTHDEKLKLLLDALKARAGLVDGERDGQPWYQGQTEIGCFCEVIRDAVGDLLEEPYKDFSKAQSWAKKLKLNFGVNVRRLKWILDLAQERNVCAHNNPEYFHQEREDVEANFTYLKGVTKKL